MQLYNVILVWDVYSVANSPEEARAVANAFIKDGLKSSEEVALEVRDRNNVRAAWENERPFVAGDVSDDDFESLKGKTTHDVFVMLHEKAASK